MMDELGAGFYLAMHDLEIRGAGEVLGASQSGEMLEVGFHMYSEMLGRAVAALQQGQDADPSQPLAVTTEIRLHAPALLPDDYAPDVHQRLTLYKRLADCTLDDELSQLHEEGRAVLDARPGRLHGIRPPPARAVTANSPTRCCW
jgi:transcription-repair coupling factor (superfamily II helicase)